MVLVDARTKLSHRIIVNRFYDYATTLINLDPIHILGGRVSESIIENRKVSKTGL